MNASTLTHPADRWQGRFDAVPPLAWLALQAAALWPHWRWAAARVADGSDDPLGVAALAVLLCVLWRLAPTLRGAPRPGWLALALGVSVSATVAVLLAPPLFGALLAALAMAAGLRAFMPAGQAMLPLAGLAVLALPVVSSLQFYAGYPLRVLTAEASTRLLQAVGMAAQRSGTAMQVQGKLIVVDAPCSGVQMVWMAYFCACAVAAFNATSDRTFVRRLPWVGVLVLCGNVLRNSVLVALEAQRASVPELVHQGVGLIVLALVCAAVVVAMRGAGDARAGVSPPETPSALPPEGATPVARRSRFQGVRLSQLVSRTAGDVGAPSKTQARVLFAAVLCLCALAPWARQGSASSAAPAMSPVASEWPAAWGGKPLRPLAFSAVEQRFAAHFPGRMVRLTDGEQVLVLREVRQPTRMLHPAADCYRGLGYRISQGQLEHDAQQRLWRCFVAERDGRRTRVCERIVDAQGLAYTDASSWFWAAQLGTSTGPWQAITTARAL